MTQKFDFKKDREERIYRRKVLESLLVSSVKDEPRFPTIGEFVLSEVVNGAIQFVDGDAGKVDYQRFRTYDKDFEIELWKYFEAEMRANFEGKIDPKVREAMEGLCKVHYVSPTGPGRPSPETELYDHFLGIRPLNFKSSFLLPKDFIRDVRTRVIPSFSDTERKSIEGVGRAMGTFVDRDLDFIRKTYLW